MFVPGTSFNQMLQLKNDPAQVDPAVAHGAVHLRGHWYTAYVVGALHEPRELFQRNLQ